MIVIVEGADLVGKSTLVERLSASTGWGIAKIRWALLGDPEIETRAMAASTIELLRATRANVIFDRAYFSWWAYAPALGYDTAYMPALISDIAVLEDVHLIVLTAEEATLRQRFAQKPDKYFPVDVILAANARFPSLVNLLPPGLPRLHINTTYTSADEVYAQAKAFLGV